MSDFEATGITKSFGGIAALRDVSLRVGPGEAVGLVGPNGAGKTTLFDCMMGVIRPDAGDVRYRGRDISRLPVHRRARLGMTRTFQRLELFLDMTAREHLLVAERARRGGGSLWRDLLNRGASNADEEARAAQILELVGLTAVADDPVESLGLGHGRLVELGRALISDPDLLLLDEPSSGLDRVEALALAGVLHDVRRERGMAVLLVEHDLDLVVRVVDRLYVLDHGLVIAEGPVDVALADPAVREAYLGEVV